MGESWASVCAVNWAEKEQAAQSRPSLLIFFFFFYFQFSFYYFPLNFQT